MSQDITKFQRYEFKYLLRASTADSIESEIKNFMSLDANVKDVSAGSYFVRSQYFENQLFTNFYEKVDGMKERHKYRLRSYSKTADQDSPLFLEKKSRKIERTTKGRILLSHEHLDIIYKKDYQQLLELFNHNSFIEGFVFDCIRKNLDPMVLIDYSRAPYVSAYDTNFRVTFDREIRSSISSFSKSIFSQQQHWKKVNAGFCTLEVKFLRRFPPWFRRIIQHYNLRRISISKFSTGMEACGLAQDTGL
ncbi:polyphosphate polymerase domain-containing protein [Gammaproteobacteria bacterium]|jgi:hypothetical protein|nr:polyphosphate polymerase domain-containing protein [Gammaproteobacteria bacterium]